MKERLARNGSKSGNAAQPPVSFSVDSLINPNACDLSQPRLRAAPLSTNTSDLVSSTTGLPCDRKGFARSFAYGAGDEFTSQIFETGLTGISKFSPYSLVAGGIKNVGSHTFGCCFPEAKGNTPLQQSSIRINPVTGLSCDGLGYTKAAINGAAEGAVGATAASVGGFLMGGPPASMSILARGAIVGSLSNFALQGVGCELISEREKNTLVENFNIPLPDDVQPDPEEMSQLREPELPNAQTNQLNDNSRPLSLLPLSADQRTELNEQLNLGLESAPDTDLFEEMPADPEQQKEIVINNIIEISGVSADDAKSTLDTIMGSQGELGLSLTAVNKQLNTVLTVQKRQMMAQAKIAERQNLNLFLNFLGQINVPEIQTAAVVAQNAIKIYEASASLISALTSGATAGSIL